MDSLRVLAVRGVREDGHRVWSPAKGWGSQCQAERQGLNAVSRVRVRSRGRS